MEEYASNSQKSKREAAEREKRRVEKVVSGPVRPRKKSELQKVADSFISEDVSNIKQYILMDVLIPSIKRAVSEIVTNGINMLLYGEAVRTEKKSNASKISSRTYYNSQEPSQPTPRTGSVYDYDEYTITNRGEAEEVLSSLEDMIERYGTASVADFYELLGVSCNFTDYNYGWSDLRNARVVSVRDGYVIKFPKAMPIER